MDENERLRRENIQLNKELSRMKNLCNSIYMMMSNYATSNPSEGNSSQQTVASETTTMKLLDLLPLKHLSEHCAGSDNDVGCGSHRGSLEPEEDISPRLFGVPIGVKRAREGSNGPADWSRCEIGTVR
ncbi:hypothetical protein L2E82_07207 [Cichorium intybus]|uniref:Uncharacterized protein n=1 Tax=Cichorium intybus TaxID=13427 RepID=A0ACB9G512_CICIN|nr:hypothetical protein L2E82_07207 [Cichorium intybus]